MGDYKYQFSNFNLFDYAGVERHLEKMAAKGWRFDSIGSFFWKYKKAEPANLKYSVTYIPESSEFDPEPLEKQKDMEAYCEEAGWKKAGNWLQMQIFYSENPAAVPIETDEELRLEYIHKSVKKNFLTSHLLLFFVFLINMGTQFSTAKRNPVEFLSDSGRLWNCGIFLWGILLLVFDVIYYFTWMHRVKKAVTEGHSCPEPKGYRHWNRLAWCVLLILIFGMFASYTSGMIWFMLVYLASLILIVFVVRKVQKKMKAKGFSKQSNVALSMILCVVLSIVLVGGMTALLIGFDIRLTEKREAVDVILVNGREWEVYQDTLPLYVEDLEETKHTGSSCEAKEQATFLVGYGDYSEYLFEGKEVMSVKVANRYEVITVKADFLYDFLLKSFYEREFRHWDEEEKEKVEYRVVYENENGKICRQYYGDRNDIAFVAYDWLVLTKDKIVPMTLYLDDLTEEQMKIMVDKFAE